MVAIDIVRSSSSSNSTAHTRANARIAQILRITAQHFSISALPDSALALPQGEFKDPLPYRWVDAPRPAHQLLHRASASANANSSC